ncbi:tRNA-intron lyase [Methanobacterium formicicum]|uniref:tRNA-splicing endonuclease n=1 Tax=Methanobacterium formicicum (strain DSM 3637 / PP1) TaxID=1204725 RepID=K2QYW3_METFP|nr:tRNA-intron lyase [Methanobacterium formicicum]EKF85498.1 tRNA-splicing endonuclease subunit alpha [Methanobacterium formicicum DSM 3637]
MDAELIGELVIIKDKKAVALSEKSHYGKFNQDELQLSLMEAFYLQEKGKIKILDKKNQNKVISPDEMREFIQDKDLIYRYMVYRDLRNRGYIVKTGFKYGSEFRLYERGKSPGDGHSDFVVKVVTENQDISVLDFSSYVRVAHGVNKKLLLAVVDDEQDITYYNVEWTRP